MFWCEFREVFNLTGEVIHLPSSKDCDHMKSLRATQTLIVETPAGHECSKQGEGAGSVGGFGCPTVLNVSLRFEMCPFS